MLDTEFMKHSGIIRRWALVVLIAAAAVSSAGCYVEQRADGTWWACDTAQTQGGPIEACQPIEIGIGR
jgi:hypothetical protein